MDMPLFPGSAVYVWFTVLIIGLTVQLGYLFLLQSKLAFFKMPDPSPGKPPVSIIIAARNEAQNLRNNLPVILSQDYPDFEVVVVNDSSYDDTGMVLEEFQKSEPRLKVVNISENERFDGGKKFAVTLGIKKAKHERLLFTDADCRPVSGKWIEKTMEAILGGRSIILGYSPYIKGAGLLNRLIRFDAYSTALNYFNFALSGIPYMGVGRNLSYTKSSFFSVGGFKSHYRLPSGDDDLLVNQIADKGNTAICVDLESHVESMPESSWKGWWRQKRRHLTTGTRYKLLHRFLLIVYPLSLLFFWSAALVLIVTHNWLEITLMLILLRVLCQIYIFRHSSRWLGQTDLTIWAPVLEILNMLFTTCAHVANAVSKRVTWKK